MPSYDLVVTYQLVAFRLLPFPMCIATGTLPLTLARKQLWLMKPLVAFQLDDSFDLVLSPTGSLSVNAFHCSDRQPSH